MARNRLLPMAAALAALTPGVAGASVVVSNSGSLSVSVYAQVAYDYTQFVNYYRDIQTDQDSANFIGAPTSLQVSANASTNPKNEAESSIAVDAHADWTSPDHGTVDINAISSVYQDGQLYGQGHYRASYAQSNGNPWFYSFTPTVDALLTMSVTGTEIFNGHRFTEDDVIFRINGTDHRHDFSGNGTVSDTFHLTAGQVYGISAFPYFIDEALSFGEEDYTRISTRHFAFDIVADPTAPPTSPALPEPMTWAMFLIGFGLIGGTLRARRVRPRAVSVAGF